MKRLIPILTLSLLVSADCWAQTAASSQADASAASGDLAEASKLSQQALALYSDKRYSDALPLAKRVVEIREKALGSRHELVAVSLNNVELVSAALRVAKRWRFSPTKLGGRPVKVIGTLTFNFTL